MLYILYVLFTLCIYKIYMILRVPCSTNNMSIFGIWLSCDHKLDYYYYKLYKINLYII